MVILVNMVNLVILMNNVNMVMLVNFIILVNLITLVNVMILVKLLNLDILSNIYGELVYFVDSDDSAEYHNSGNSDNIGESVVSGNSARFCVFSVGSIL